MLNKNGKSGNGRKSEVGRTKSEVRSRKSEDGRQKMEVGRPKTPAWLRQQAGKTEDRSRKTEDRRRLPDCVSRQGSRKSETSILNQSSISKSPHPQISLSPHLPVSLSPHRPSLLAPRPSPIAHQKVKIINLKPSINSINESLYISKETSGK